MTKIKRIQYCDNVKPYPRYTYPEEDNAKLHAGTYVIIDVTVLEHDDGTRLEVRHQPPEVNDCIGHRCLGDDVGVALLVSLQVKVWADRVATNAVKKMAPKWLACCYLMNIISTI